MSSFALSKMPSSASEIFTIYASFTATLMLIRSMVNDVIPSPIRKYIQRKLEYWFTTMKPNSPKLTLVVEKKAGYIPNEVYDAAETYLRTKISPNVDRLKISKTPRQKHITAAIEQGEEIDDEFKGVKLLWQYVLEKDENNKTIEKNKFELRFDKKFKQVIMDEYIPYVLSQSKEIRDGEKVVKIFSRGHGSRGGGADEYAHNGWGSIDLEHPSNFDTLAMEPVTKKMIIEDLDRFLGRKDFYKRVGKAWKRGYLLYGPPGTGKSSLIAAIANYLNFDIYDLELSNLYSNTDLRRVLLETKNQSVLVIEDIDCSAPEVVQDRDSDYDSDDEPTPLRPQATQERSQLTLSGLLNFIDGLWSSAGDERIIIFTTNHREKIDPALLRPGRMDMHIHMSYCTFSGFKILASNYLGIKDDEQHPMYEQIQTLMETTSVTPAEIAEELMKSDDCDVVLNGLVNFLKGKNVKKNDQDKSDAIKSGPKQKKRKNSDYKVGRNVIRRLGGR